MQGSCRSLSLLCCPVGRKDTRWWPVQNTKPEVLPPTGFQRLERIHLRCNRLRPSKRRKTPSTHTQGCSLKKLFKGFRRRIRECIKNGHIFIQFLVITAVKRTFGGLNPYAHAHTISTTHQSDYNYEGLRIRLDKIMASAESLKLRSQ